MREQPPYGRSPRRAPRFLPVLALLVGAAVLPVAGVCGGQAYRESFEALAAQEHRQPGSANFDAAVEVLSAKLRAAGLQPRVMTFDTVAPKTMHCRLLVGGVEAGPVYPVDNGVAPVVTTQPIEGPLVWLGSGRIESLKGIDVRGCIAVLDLDDPAFGMETVFAFGARAVVLVGSDRGSQWIASRAYAEGPMSAPRVYMRREDAERAGLTTAAGIPAVLDTKVVVEDRIGKNLWVEIPGEPGAEFRLGAPEAIVLSATLDTSGLVPDLSPQTRYAANAALLADVVTGLAADARERPLKRSVFAVFLGARNYAQEGVRHFYYAVERANMADDDVASLAFRRAKYREEMDSLLGPLAACARDDVLSSTDADAAFLRPLLRQRLAGWVNNMNAALRDTRIEQDGLARRIRNLEQQPDDADAAAEIESARLRIAELDQADVGMNDRKRRWNDIRRQLTQRAVITDAESRETYAATMHRVAEHLEARRRVIERMLRHAETSQELADAVGSRLVVGHFDFDFADADAPWMFSVVGANDLFAGDGVDPGSFLMHFSELGAAYDRSGASALASSRLFKDALSPYYKPFSLSCPYIRSVPSTPALMLGIPGYQMMTVGDPLRLDELPVRTQVDLEPLAEPMRLFFREAAQAEGLSLRAPMPKPRSDTQLTYLLNRGDDFNGRQFVTLARGSSDMQGPSSGSLALIRPLSHSGLRPQPGLSLYPVARVNPNGYIFAPLLNRAKTRVNYYTFAFGYDDDGVLRQASTQASAYGGQRGRVESFYAYGGGVFSWGFGPDLHGAGQSAASRILNAKTDAAHRNACSLDSPGQSAFLCDREENIKRIGNLGELLIGAKTDAYLGVGIPIDAPSLLNLNAVAQCANDYWILNEFRLKALRQRNIVDDAMEALHAEVREHIDDAAAELELKDYPRAQGHWMHAVAIANRIHLPLRGITEDLVRAVVVLLLLSIPFAFAMERLLCGFTSIYKQVIGFIAFFLGTFAILFVTHPAFSLANAPIVIFLAFVIILLSSMTVSIVMGKIKQEIRAIQGLASTVHGSESDTSTALAAILIGISGMRNRPLKTFLTAATVILLTFTILVFASFTAQLGVVESYLGQGQDEDRIELHRFSFLDIPQSLVDAITTLRDREFRVFPRGALFRSPVKAFDHGLTTLSADRVVYHVKSGKVAAFGAILGIEPAELDVNAKLARLVPGLRQAPSPYPPLCLPADSAARLGAEPGDELRLMGVSFTYAGPIAQDVFREMSTIEGLRPVPPDFESTVRNMGKQPTGGASVEELEGIDIGSFAWYAPERIAIAPYDALKWNFATLFNINFVSLYPRHGDVDIEKSGREIATVFQGAVHTKSSEGARRLYFTKAVAGSGFGDVIVPLLLGGLIIFSSLMGSIVDREREIFTYSALGLSPPDVGALFFAESAVYSVVGGMGGYLLSQVVAKTLSILGSRGLIHPPDMNFSSLSSVLTILIVMAVVMLSTIYPALKAGKSANPGVARKWRMPQPKGDRLDFVFPFTVSAPDFAGILSFIREHFENHGDASLGSFAAREVELFSNPRAGGGVSLGIRANISLAPFDLGIFQRFRMYSQEFEIKGIDEVVVELERIGGSPNSWFRENRAFADELRRQFLLWRSLPVDTVQHYRRQTVETLSGNGRAADNET